MFFFVFIEPLEVLGKNIKALSALHITAVTVKILKVVTIQGDLKVLVQK